MRPTPVGHGVSIPLIVITALAMLAPLAALPWLSPGPSAAPEPEPVEEAFVPPPKPKPAAPAAVRSSLLVPKMKDPAVPAVETLRDAPHADLDGTLTGTLAEIEAQLARERRPAPRRAARPRRTAARR